MYIFSQYQLFISFCQNRWHFPSPPKIPSSNLCAIALIYVFFFLGLPGQMLVNLRQMQRHVSQISSNTDRLAELEKIASDKGLVISDNEGSGNCMFHAVSEQLNLVKGIKISHKELRQSIVQYLRKNPKLVSCVFFSLHIFWLK